MKARTFFVVWVLILMGLGSLTSMAETAYGIGVWTGRDGDHRPTPYAWPFEKKQVIKDFLKIQGFMSGNRAEPAGLRVGDEIIKIGGHAVAGMTFNDACNLLRGPEGSAVEVTVRRAGRAAPLSVTVSRGPLNFR